MRETESLCAENIDLKDIARSRRGELISRRELIMYYNPGMPSITLNISEFSGAV